MASLPQSAPASSAAPTAAAGLLSSASAASPGAASASAPSAAVSADPSGPGGAGGGDLALDRCLERLLSRGERLSEDAVVELCRRLKLELVDSPNVAMVRAPCTVVGDIHGAFPDLLELFAVGGAPPDTNYVFLGNVVDRGSASVEVVSLLALLRLRFPDRVTLLRGGHESAALSRAGGFYAECMRKYGPAGANVWRHFADLFNFLQLAAVVLADPGPVCFCVHGGLSPAVATVDQIRVLDRFCDVPAEGPVTDLLWSDPDPDREGFSPSPRGVGCVFGGDAVRRFLAVNKLGSVCRSNQLCLDGFQTLFEDRLATVWSAPNFLGTCRNVAAVAEIADTGAVNFNTFDPRPDAFRPPAASTPLHKEFPDYFR